MEKKSNLVTAIVSSVVCLLPIILSVMVYNDLPERMPMQWNFAGEPNWYAHKAIAAFGMPVFFLLMNIFVRWFLNTDPKRENQSKAMRTFAIWLIPFLSLTIVPFMLYSAMNDNMPSQFMITALMVFIGIIFIICGNFMNKNRQNYSIGIRLPWTLNDADNWNKTHRMAGPLWILGGLILIIVSLLPLENYLMIVSILAITAIIVIVPVIYSYSLYRKSKSK